MTQLFTILTNLGRCAFAPMLACALCVAIVTPRWLSPCCAGESEGMLGEACCVACASHGPELPAAPCDDCLRGVQHDSDHEGEEPAPGGCTACVAPCCLKAFSAETATPIVSTDDSRDLVAYRGEIDQPNSRMLEGIFRPPRA